MTQDTGKTVLVHKEGDEGTITCDAITGRIITPVDERPDWADQLAVALLQEREHFYRTRLGDKAANYLLEPEAIAFQDLGFVGVDAEGDEMELEADSDYRMDVVARALGIDREDFESEAQFGQTLAEAELDMSQQAPVNPEEAQALDEEMASSFGVGSDAAGDQAKKSQEGSGG